MKIWFGLLVLMFSVSVNAQFKMAFVDLHKVVQSTSAGRKVKADLEAQFNVKKREMDSREEKLKKQEQELESLRPKLSPENYNRRLAQLERQVLEYRDFSTRTQIEFSQKELAVTTPILEKIRRVISRVSKESGYTVVMEKTAQVLHSPEADDLTMKIAREFEKEK